MMYGWLQNVACSETDLRHAFCMASTVSSRLRVAEVLGQEGLGRDETVPDVQNRRDLGLEDGCVTKLCREHEHPSTETDDAL